MAFKSDIFASIASADPAAHFKTLTKRQFPDVMPHQKVMLEQYAAQLEDKSDVALQLPTGSGKRWLVYSLPTGAESSLATAPYIFAPPSNWFGKQFCRPAINMASM
jgi:superfamily II DNA/RNA helicase